MRVYLSGPMGAGKSTLAREAAAALGLTPVDLDARIEAAAGKSIAEIFRDEGAQAFRVLERSVALAVAAEDDVVVALGGGTVVDPEVRRLLRRTGTLLTLTAPPQVLARRVGADANRPLLGADPLEALTKLVRERAAAYAECHGRVDTSKPGAVDAIVRLARDRRVLVALGERSYVVEIGRGVRSRLPARIEGRSTLAVADENTRRWRDAIAPEARSLDLPAGEEHKSLETVARIWDEALDAGIDRRGLLVAVGGGVVGDLTGFAAATLLRGVGFGQVPTSLLAMVDSSVGGKTGVNRPAGKNLVGAFHQPQFVLCDVETLRTLPAREAVAGRAEIVKAAWLQGEEAVGALEAEAEALRAGDLDAHVSAVMRSVALKARIVEDDEREADLRRLLNLGHTLGHALEAAGAYRRWVHGEAVALGLVAAARLGVALGRMRSTEQERLLRLIARLGLPVDLDAALSDEVFGYVLQDKKREGDRVNFVVPGRPGETTVVPLSLEELRRGLES